MIKCALDEICSVYINDNLYEAEVYLLKNHMETVFVIDAENNLHGIITKGDFLKKDAGALSVSDIMNKEYKSVDSNDSEEKAQNIFKTNTRITAIPVLDNRRLEHVYKREPSVYERDIVDFCLNLRKNDEILVNILKDLNLKTIKVIAKNELLVFTGEILSKYFEVVFVDNYTELTGRKFDMVLTDNYHAMEAKKLSFEGNFVCNLMLLKLFSTRVPQIINNIKELRELTRNVFLFILPLVYDVINPNETEISLINKSVIPEIIAEGIDIPDKKEYIKKVRYNSIKAIEKNNEVRYSDYTSEYLNIINGRRITTDYIGNYKHNLFVLGNSVVMGYIGAEDKYTIPSFLQRIQNDTDKTYKVINCGVSGNVSFYNLAKEVRKDDKIILICGGKVGEYMSKTNSLPDFIKVVKLHQLFNRPHSMGNVFYDISHVNSIGNKYVAEELAKIMNENPEVGVVRHDPEEVFEQLDESELMENGLGAFISNISQYKKDALNIGAIVMNCNPFTLGHRYLIERAAGQVEHLYIFVVEEDRSYFKFEDRLALVKEGTADLHNVTVLPSGQFIISSITFEEYFDKDALQGAEIDPAADIEIFGKYIAPALNIKKRFAGEEPIDYVTRQYNKTMCEILPKYGIEFIEIPRKEHGSKPISASDVRKHISENNIEKIKEIVPRSTFEYIVNNLIKSV